MKRFTKLFAAFVSAAICCSTLSLLTSAHEMTSFELIEKYEFLFDYVQSDNHLEWTNVGLSCSTVYVDANGVIDENPDVVAILEQYRDTYPVMPGTLYHVTKDGAAWGDPTTGAWLYFGTLSDSFYYRVREDGTAQIIGCDYQAFADAGTTVLEIPSEIDGYTVTTIGQDAFNNLDYNIKTLERIVVPDSVLYILDRAFYGAGCDVNIPNQVQLISHLSYGLLLDKFNGNVNLPDTLEYLDYSAFIDTIVTECRIPEHKLLGGYVLHIDSDSPIGEQGFLRSIPFNDYVTNEEIAAYHAQKEAAAKSLPTIAPNGDVNQSGTTEIGDAILLSRMVAEDASVTVSAEGIAAADVVTDGTLDGADITAILQIIANPNA